jgi:hypothetical protein
MDGKCEVFPDKRCVWDMAWNRSKWLSRFGIGKLIGVSKTFETIKPPVDWRLWGTPSWWHLATGRIDIHGNAVPPKEEMPTAGVGSAGKAETAPGEGRSA